MSKSILLSELNVLIKGTLKEGFPGNYNITAEISEFNESRGHAYLELVEKNENDQLIAKAGATIWASTYRMLKPYFESATGHYLEAGLKVLIVVTVEFHEVYGLSLNIKDIDPTYTVGDIEQKRLAIIKKLEDEGVLNMNKELDFPVVPQRIAVISSKTAAGLGDFMNQLSENSHNFAFKTVLFQAAVQGKETEESVIEALDSIFEQIDEFDLVVIIRGGGSKSDLRWFDSYDIAVNIAQFPIPIITGIGHERDESITDTVAYTNLKTPTAAADFLINEMFKFYAYLTDLGDQFSNMINDRILEEKNKLEQIKSSLHPIFLHSLMTKGSELDIIRERIRNSVKENITKHAYKLDKYPLRLKKNIDFSLNNSLNHLDLIKIDLKNRISKFISNLNHEIEVYSQKNNYLDPNNVLQRGYSITTFNGKTLKSITDIKKDDIIKTHLSDGTFKSKVEK